MKAARLLASAVPVLWLMVPGVLVPAAAAIPTDDPQPSVWPTVDSAAAGADKSDPQPTGWTPVAAPKVDEQDDPGPLSWPTLVPG